MLVIPVFPLSHMILCANGVHVTADNKPCQTMQSQSESATSECWDIYSLDSLLMKFFEHYNIVIQYHKITKGLFASQRTEYHPFFIHFYRSQHQVKGLIGTLCAYSLDISSASLTVP